MVDTIAARKRALEQALGPGTDAAVEPGYRTPAWWTALKASNPARWNRECELDERDKYREKYGAAGADDDDRSPEDRVKDGIAVAHQKNLTPFERTIALKEVEAIAELKASRVARSIVEPLRDELDMTRRLVRSAIDQLRALKK